MASGDARADRGERQPADEALVRRWLGALSVPEGPRVRAHGRLPAPDASVGFKLFRRRGLDAWRGRILGVSPARREHEIARWLRERGVAVPPALGLAEGGLGRGRDVVFFRWIDDARELAAEVLAGRLGPRESARLAPRLGALVRAMHDAGVIHRDLHAGNVLLGPEGPLLIDFHRSRRRRAPSWAARARDLLDFSHFFHRRARARDKLRFLRAYGAPFDGPRAARHAALRRMQARAERSLARFFAHHDRRSLGGGRAFRVLNRDGWRGVGLADDPPDAAPAPERDGDRVLHRSQRGRVVLRTDAAGRHLVLKWYEDPGPGGLLRHLLRGSRARRAWQNLHRLATAEIPTPAPHFFLARPWWARRRPSVLAMSWVDLPALHRLELPPDSAAWTCLGRQLARMHDDLLRNRDLKAENLLVDPVRGEVVWLDPDGVRRRRRRRRRELLRDLMRLNASFGPRQGPSAGQRLRFLRGYVRARATREPELPASEICRLTEDKWRRSPPTIP